MHQVEGKSVIAEDRGLPPRLQKNRQYEDPGFLSHGGHLQASWLDGPCFWQLLARWRCLDMLLCHQIRFWSAAFMYCELCCRCQQSSNPAWGSWVSPFNLVECWVNDEGTQSTRALYAQAVPRRQAGALEQVRLTLTPGLCGESSLLDGNAPL